MHCERKTAICERQRILLRTFDLNQAETLTGVTDEKIRPWPRPGTWTHILTLRLFGQRLSVMDNTAALI